MQHGECLFILFNFSSIKYVFPPYFYCPKTIKPHTHIFFTIMENNGNGCAIDGLAFWCTQFWS